MDLLVAISIQAKTGASFAGARPLGDPFAAISDITSCFIHGSVSRQVVATLFSISRCEAGTGVASAIEGLVTIQEEGRARGEWGEESGI